MARKEISTKWDRENRNNMNDNFKELYNTTNNFVEKVSEEAFGKVIDASKLVWKEPVDSQSDLPSSASEGDTRMARDTGKVYRFDGSEWKEIQQIDSSPINEIDDRLSSQLAQKAEQDEVDDFKNATGASLAAIVAKYELEPMPPPIIIENLWDAEEVVLGNVSTTSGNLTESSSIYRTDYIPVQPNTYYTRGVGSIPAAPSYVTKIVFYDENKSIVEEGHENSIAEHEHVTVTSPEGAAFAIVTAARSMIENFYFVVGDEPLTDENDGDIYDGGFWEDVPTPPLKENSVNSLHLKEKIIRKKHLSDEILFELNKQVDRKRPNPPRLNFEDVGDGTHHTPLFLSEDGEVLYFSRYYELLQSTDEYETVQQIGVDFEEQVRGMRILSDGELIVSTGRVEAEGKKAEVWKSENYDRNNPESTTFKKVHEAIGEAADFYNDWGIDVHGELVLLCEYGQKNGTGARRVYLSKDHGESFELIFHQGEEHQKAGIEYDEGSAHTHTAAYDPWFNRIWVCAGDGVNTSTWYSDDFGKNWHLVEGSNGLSAVQYTGIIAMEDGVVFGSDRSPNGLYIWRRTKSRNDKVVIEPFQIINDIEVTSHIFQMPFRRKIGEPVYFGSAWDTRAGDGHAVVMGFVDGKGADIVYEFPTKITEEMGNRGLRYVIGNTAGGYVYTAFRNPITSEWKLLRAEGLVWE